jgi:hypothetical protein
VPLLCARCHNDLPTEETGELTYCSHCGAAQIALSEELREQFEQQQLATADLDGHASQAPSLMESLPLTAGDPTAVVWSSALQLIALAAAVFAVLMLLQILLAPVALLTTLWLFGAPIILLGIYCARNPATRVTSGFGARLGLLSGLSLGITGFAVQTIEICVKRFVFHHGSEIDESIVSLIAQMQTQQQPQLAQMSAEQADIVRHFYSYFAIPEFVVGGALIMALSFLVFYALYSAIAGSFSGFLRARAAAR